MKYTTYPTYKDSGIAWLGEIPEHWEVRKLKRTSKIVNGATPSTSNNENWDGDILCITPAEINNIIYISDSIRKITQIGYESCGTHMIPKNSIVLTTRDPNIKGFSSQNIWRMKQFYETYKDHTKLSSLLREISWTHNTIIFSSCNTTQEREFYIRMANKEKWSSRELKRQIDSSSFERVMLADTKLSATMRVLPQDISNTFKDSYVLELLHIPEAHKEKDLRHCIAQNITTFLLEFGRDFSFMGQEYPLQVGNQDFAIDLLFYHRALQCLVAIELKTETFKPAHLGQLNFYVEALDQTIKKPNENPSIGILLCKGKDDTVVKYALNTSLSPTLVADYKTKLPNKKILQQRWQQVLEQLNNDTE